MNDTRPRPGYRLVDGVEQYDLNAHVLRAFEGVPIGKSKLVAEIRGGGVRANIPGSHSVTLNTIYMVIQELVQGRRNIPGLVGDYDGKGRLIAYPKVEQPPNEEPQHFSNQAVVYAALVGEAAASARLDGETIDVGPVTVGEPDRPFPADSLHNPVVKCCDRDAADCDCGPLEKMYAEARDLHGDKATEIEDHAREAAISLIIDGGFDVGDSDLLGGEMGGIIQTHLMIVFMRQPEMIDNLVNNGNLVL